MPRDAGDPHAWQGLWVYIVADASGGVSVEAHEMAIQ
jgi:hypothetical protein